MWVTVFKSLLLPQGERFGIVLGYSYQGILLLYPQTAPPTAGEQWDPKTSVGEEAAGPGEGGIREPTARQGRPGPSICGEDHPAATGVDLGPPFPFQCFSTPPSACGDNLSLPRATSAVCRIWSPQCTPTYGLALPSIEHNWALIQKRWMWLSNACWGKCSHTWLRVRRTFSILCPCFSTPTPDLWLLDPITKLWQTKKKKKKCSLIDFSGKDSNSKGLGGFPPRASFSSAMCRGESNWFTVAITGFLSN